MELEPLPELVGGDVVGIAVPNGDGEFTLSIRRLNFIDDQLGTNYNISNETSFNKE